MRDHRYIELEQLDSRLLYNRHAMFWSCVAICLNGNVYILSYLSLLSYKSVNI